MQKTFINDFTTGPIVGPLIRFGLPILMANLLQVVYNMVDMAIVGNVEGQVGLSAVSIGGEITEFLTVFTIGFSSAAQVIISQELGAAQKNKIGKLIGTFALTLFITAVICMSAAIIFVRDFLSLLNTPEEAFGQAVGYSLVVACGLLFVYGYNAVSAILRGLGDSKHPFVFITMSAILNIILDLLFVSVIHMGAAGAALATVIAQALSFACSLIFLIRNKAKLGFEICRKDFRIDKESFFTLIKLGIPMALRNACVSITRFFINSYIYSYGITVTAVTGIGSKLNTVSVQISSALNTAGSSMIGQNIGAENYKRVPRIMLAVGVINVSCATVLSALMLIIPGPIYRIFTSDMTIMPVAMQYVPIAIAMFYGVALRSCSNALVNGSGNFAVNLIAALLDSIILRVGLSLVLGLACNMGYPGFWWGNAISGFAPFFIGMVFLASGKWKTRKHIIKTENS